MNEREQNYVTAFEKMQSDKTMSNTIIQKRNGINYEISSIFKNDSYIKFSFYPISSKMYSTTYRDGCDIVFKNVPDKIVQDIFKNQDYNYDIVTQTLDELYEVGKYFGFYTDITPVKKIKVEDSFIKKNNSIETKMINIAKITLANFLTQKRTNSNPMKKMINYYLFLQLDQNNEIHPIMYIILPYCVSYGFRVTINLHPSKKDEQLKMLQEQKNNFKVKLEDYFNIALKRNLKIKTEDIDMMSLEDKLKHIAIMEMIRI